MDIAVSHAWQQARRSRKGVVNIASAKKPHDVEASTLDVRQSKMDMARLNCRIRDPRGVHFPAAEDAMNAVSGCASLSDPSWLATDHPGSCAVSVPTDRKGAYVHPCLLSVTEDRLSRTKADFRSAERVRHSVVKLMEPTGKSSPVSHENALPCTSPVWRRSLHSTQGWPVMGAAASASWTGNPYNLNESEAKAGHRGEGRQSTYLITNLYRRSCEC